MISKQHEESVVVVRTSLDGFEDGLHHVVHLLLFLHHMRGSGSTHVSDVVDSQVVQDHRVPVVLFHLSRYMAGDIAVDFGVLLWDDRSV